MTRPRAILVALLGILACAGGAWSQDGASFFRESVERMQKTSGEVGIQVVSLPSGQVMWEHHSGVPLVPASLVKILTSYAALKHFQPTYRFKTFVYAAAAPRNGVVDGDVWIKSEGDIFFVTESVAALADKLKQAGIRVIRGGIYTDNSYFRPETEQICLDERCDQSYNPVISATALDYNTLTFKVSPGARAGLPVRVEWSPPGDYVHLNNQAATGPRKSKNQPNLRSVGVTGDGRQRFHLAGKIPLNSRYAKEFRFHVREPASFFSRSVKKLIEAEGIEVAGSRSGKGTVPPNAVTLAVYESPPLSELLEGLNRYSNNFMAEMLLRSLGGYTGGSPGTADKGVVAVTGTLRGLDVPEREVTLHSGSGLSRSCRVSPRVFCRVLASAFADPVISPAFLSSLAENGSQGTLRKRICTPDVQVRGKTGTLNDVVSFAGYVSGCGQGPVAVAVLLNQVQNRWEAREALDSFLERLPLNIESPR